MKRVMGDLLKDIHHVPFLSFRSGRKAISMSGPDVKITIKGGESPL
jgi:hypothetical protein